MLVLLGQGLAPSLQDYFNAKAADDSRMVVRKPYVGQYPSTEARVNVQNVSSEIKGQPVMLMHSTGPDGTETPNDRAMSLLLTVRTLKRYGAGPVWVVMPFMAYGRQDRQFDNEHNALGLDDFSFLLKQAGAAGVSTIDLHSEKGLGDLKDNLGQNNVYNLSPLSLFAADLQEQFIDTPLVIGGPDAGAHDNAKALAKALGTEIFAFQKVHTDTSKVEVVGFEGNVAGKATITLDDMIDTGGTIEKSQTRLKTEGATARYVYSTHGIFGKDGLRRLFSAVVDQDTLVNGLVLTNTIDVGPRRRMLEQDFDEADVTKRLRCVNVAPLLYDHIANDLVSHPAMKATVA